LNLLSRATSKRAPRARRSATWPGRKGGERHHALRGQHEVRLSAPRLVWRLDRGPKFDPQLIVLAVWAPVEAIFLSTFLFIAQNRQTKEEGRRADLDLQVNLLAEHELSR